MRRTVAMILTLLLCSCAANQEAVKETVEPAPQTKTAPVLPPDKPVFEAKRKIKSLYGELIKDVTISKASFNPSINEMVSLAFFLVKPSTVTLNVYDADSFLIKALANGESLGVGKQTIVWDGKDLDGKVVPDEAYYFTIKADTINGESEIYDPTTFSGGLSKDIVNAHIDPQHYTIHYTLPEMGRVMIRQGIHGGPLLNQLVDWEPRVKGAITEYWNGKDHDNLIDIFQHPKFKMIITYFTLPENSVIAYGNKTTYFRGYKNNLTSSRPKKEPLESSVNQVSPHYTLSRAIDYTPEITLSIDNVKGYDEKGLPILNEKTLVKVAIDEKDKATFQSQQFEICFFLNHKFYAEDETGYTPFNWVWDLSNVDEGEHLLTVNISSFKDQIGIISRKVRVVK